MTDGTRGRGYDRSPASERIGSADDGRAGTPDRRGLTIIRIDRLISIIGVAFCVCVGVITVISLLSPLGII